MAKVPFTKLKLKTDESVKQVKINDDVIIEVKQYLPVQEKLRLIGDVVMQAHEQDENYSNPVTADVYRDLEVVFAYSNISFTDKQKEDLPKLYDMLVSSGLMKEIITTIPEEEYGKICCGVWNTIESIYKYQNSVLGILDTIKSDYSNLEYDANKIKNALGDPENMALLKDVLGKLG